LLVHVRKATQSAMKIGIIGAGNVGGTLRANLGAKGHNVVFGVRDPDSEKMRSFLNSIPGEARQA